MDLVHSCSVKKLQPLVQLSRDYLYKNITIFKEQKDEKSKAKNTFR